MTLNYDQELLRVCCDNLCTAGAALLKHDLAPAMKTRIEVTSAHAAELARALAPEAQMRELTFVIKEEET